MKSYTFRGLRFVFSGVVPKEENLWESDIWIKAEEFGAKCFKAFTVENKQGFSLFFFKFYYSVYLFIAVNWPQSPLNRPVDDLLALEELYFGYESVFLFYFFPWRSYFSLALGISKFSKF